MLLLKLQAMSFKLETIAFKLFEFLESYIVDIVW